MHFLKKVISQLSGYWIHRISTLPIGVDLFLDIEKKLKYSNLNTFFDVGANIGQTLNWFKFNKPHSKIYSFEPVSYTYQILKQNAAKFNDCFLENFAFGDEDGTKTIKLYEQELSVLNSLRNEHMNNNLKAKDETISIKILDNYCYEKSINAIDLLKIDTEGYEIQVLKGAERMLSKNKISFILCETGFHKKNTRNTYFPDLTEYLEYKGYLFFGFYQMDMHDLKRGNHLGNALFVNQDQLKLS